MEKAAANTTKHEMLQEMQELRRQLAEANDTIDAIRTGQIDALVVAGDNGHQLYTLQSADHTYRIFIEKMTEGAVTLNTDGVVLFANSQFAAMAGLPLSKVIGAGFQTFITKNFTDQYASLFTGCWYADSKGEVELRGAAGTIPVQLSLTPLELEGGITLSIIITDLTLQKAAQKQLEETNRQLGKMNQSLEASNHDLQQFASVASHDLQEPLRKIMMFANLLTSGGNLLTKDQRTYLEKISNAAGRMKILIADVLNYSKLSANNGGFSSTGLTEIVSELLEDFELMILEKNAVIQLDALPVVQVNRGQLRQVFQNLISNALKFSKSDEPPVITISAKIINQKSFTATQDAGGGFCLLTIADNGIGFDEKYASTIFSLFERLHSKDQYEGTGIGLAITKKIIEKHQGLIAASSSPGHGARFHIILPMEQPQTIE